MDDPGTHDRPPTEAPGEPSEVPDLGATLRAALAPRQDVRDTARHRVDRALNARSAMAGYTSMLSCGVEALRHLLTTPAVRADRVHMTPPTSPGDTEEGRADA